jgi:hypothetical protein
MQQVLYFPSPSLGKLKALLTGNRYVVFITQHGLYLLLQYTPCLNYSDHPKRENNTQINDAF